MSSPVLTQDYFRLALGLPGAGENVTMGRADHVSAGDGALILQHGGAVLPSHSPDM